MEVNMNNYFEDLYQEVYQYTSDIMGGGILCRT